MNNILNKIKKEPEEVPNVVNLEKDYHIPMDISSNNVPISMTENEKHTKQNRRKELEEVPTNTTPITFDNSK